MSAPLPYDPLRLKHCAGNIIVNVRELSHRGWTPATSSNFSERIDDRHVAITVSGRDKGKLTERDFLLVDLDGRVVDGEGKPHIAVAMRGNTTLRLEDPRNLLRVIEDGIGEQKFAGFAAGGER